MAAPSEETRARRAGLPPGRLLGVSSIGCGLAAWSILAGHDVLAGVAALVAAVALLAGAAAGRTRRDRRAIFLSTLLDRGFDACILAPLAWVWREEDAMLAALALLGLAASFVASYERARGRSLGYRGAETAMYRAFRALILVVGLLTGWLRLALVAFDVLCVAAACARAWNVFVQERRERPLEGRP